MAVGVALALRAKGLAAQRVICLTGDAELNEGSNWEAAMLAPHLGLTNLLWLIIDNHSSEIAMTPWEPKLEAFGWTSRVVDGRDHEQLLDAFSLREPERPVAVVAQVEGYDE